MDDRINTKGGAFEVEAGKASAELARRGISPDQRVVIAIEPDDWLTRSWRETRKRVEAAGMTDEDVDKLIEETIQEVREDMKKEQSSPPR